MQSKAKKYGEYVEITAPVERTTSEEYPTIGRRNLVQLRFK